MTKPGDAREGVPGGSPRFLGRPRHHARAVALVREHPSRPRRQTAVLGHRGRPSMSWASCWILQVSRAVASGGALRPHRELRFAGWTVVRGRFRKKRDSGLSHKTHRRERKTRGKAAGRRLPRRWGGPPRGAGARTWPLGLRRPRPRRLSPRLGFDRWRQVPEVSERRRSSPRRQHHLSFSPLSGSVGASHPGRPAPRCGAVCGGS